MKVLSSKEMGDQEQKPKDEPSKKEPGTSKKKKKRDLRDESLKKDLDTDDIGEILDSGKNETTEQASRKYRQKGGQ